MVSTGSGGPAKLPPSPRQLLENQRKYVAELEAKHKAEAERVAAARQLLPEALAKMWAAVQAKQIELIAAAEGRAGGEGGEAKHDAGEWAGANFWRGWVGLDAKGPIEPGPPPPEPDPQPAPVPDPPVQLPAQDGAVVALADLPPAPPEAGGDLHPHPEPEVIEDPAPAPPPAIGDMPDDFELPLPPPPMPGGPMPLPVHAPPPGGHLPVPHQPT
jgi:hypothetical protein